MTLLTIFNDTAIIYTLFGDCDLFSRQVYEYLLKYNNTRHAIRWHCYRLHVTISLLDDMSYCMTCHTAWHVILNDMSYGMTCHTEWHVVLHDMSYCTLTLNKDTCVLETHAGFSQPSQLMSATRNHLCHYRLDVVREPAADWAWRRCTSCRTFNEPSAPEEKRWPCELRYSWVTPLPAERNKDDEPFECSPGNEYIKLCTARLQTWIRTTWHQTDY